MEERGKIDNHKFRLSTQEFLYNLISEMKNEIFSVENEAELKPDKSLRLMKVC